MKKSITISIPEPCHEDWGKMTATEKGKFCSVCTKEVFDFTKTNDEDLVKKLSAGGNMCGRFNKSQLDREVKLERKSKHSLMPYAASLLLPLSLMSSLETKAQGGANISEKPMISLGIGSHATNSIEKSIVTVTGIITDELGNPINNAEILVLETGDSFFSEKDGTYQLKCVSGSTLVFQKAGRSEHQIVLGGHNSVVNVLLQSEPLIKPQIVGRIRATPLQEIKTICEEPVEEEITGDIEVIEEPLDMILGGMVAVEQILEEKDEKNLITITGTITDEMGHPLPGVNVIQKGSSRGTQTDFDGNYTIKTASNQTLTYSYLSYEDKEITLSNIDNNLSFAMIPALMGEIIILGGFSIDENSNLETNAYKGSAPDNDYESQLKREARRNAAANEHAFKTIKKEREQARKNKK